MLRTSLVEQLLKAAHAIGRITPVVHDCGERVIGNRFDRFLDRQHAGVRARPLFRRAVGSDPLCDEPLLLFVLRELLGSRLQIAVRAARVDPLGTGDALRRGHRVPALRRCPRRRTLGRLPFRRRSAWAWASDAAARDVRDRRGMPSRRRRGARGRLRGAWSSRPDAPHGRRVRADDSARPRGTAPRPRAARRMSARRQRGRCRYRHRADS